VSAADEAEGQEIVLHLSADERELLLKACHNYRRTLPVYLRAGAQEAALLGGLIEKLSPTDDRVEPVRE